MRSASIPEFTAQAVMPAARAASVALEHREVVEQRPVDVEQNRPAQPAAPSSPSAFSTSSSCVFGETFGITWRMTPSESITNVARRAPQ